MKTVWGNISVVKFEPNSICFSTLFFPQSFTLGPHIEFDLWPFIDGDIICDSWFPNSCIIPISSKIIQFQVWYTIIPNFIIWSMYRVDFLIYGYWNDHLDYNIWELESGKLNPLSIWWWIIEFHKDNVLVYVDIII